jgi:hypothetical protein
MREIPQYSSIERPVAIASTIMPTHPAYAGFSAHNIGVGGYSAELPHLISLTSEDHLEPCNFPERRFGVIRPPKPFESCSPNAGIYAFEAYPRLLTIRSTDCWKR